MEQSTKAESVGERVPGVLLQASRSVCRFLEEVLPTLSASWWADLVVANLSFQQRRAVETRRIAALSGLDLAALLRVLDANWHGIADRLSLPSEARHYLKEMRTVRDRWAHAAASELGPDDVYRDLDTLQRFLVSIGADEELLGEVKRLKGASLAAGGQMSFTPETPAPPLATAFSVGQVVCLRSNPATTCAVIGVHPGHPEARYSVFQSGTIATYYESQLRAADVAGDLEVISLQEFDAYLSALQIRHPSTSIVYSLNAARIDCVPYQFRPVLKLIRAERPRLLIADGVGVGKTIRAQPPHALRRAGRTDCRQHCRVRLQ